MKNNVIKKLIITLLFVAIIPIDAKPTENKSKYFCIANINFREKPNITSNTIIILQKGSIFEVKERGTAKEKIMPFDDYWYKIVYEGKTGWVFGGYIIEYINQDINEFIRRYEFIRYFDNCSEWFWKAREEKQNFGCNLDLGFEFYNKNLDKNSFSINFQTYKNSESVFEKKFEIGKYVRVQEGYKLYCKGEYIDEDNKGRVLRKVGQYTKEGDYLATVGMKDGYLVLYDFKDMRSEIENNGKVIKFSTQELVKKNFEKAMTDTTDNYFQSWERSRYSLEKK